jgi:voltage-gated potassium channel
MSKVPTRGIETVLRLDVSEFWSGDLGLTLVTISLIILIFVVTPLREAGISGRIFFDLLILGLMMWGAITMHGKTPLAFVVVGFVTLSAVFIGIARFDPTASMQQFGSVFSTITLFLYVYIVLVVMFRGGPMTWSRIQGGVCAYLLIGMAWASAYQTLEEIHPGSFGFPSAPRDFDQLIARMTYFSFCTITTVGGGAVPMTSIARSLVVAEAVVGQLFPAILLGALVAMAVHGREKSSA